MRIAMFGHKRIPSREGGIEIVAEELSVRMAAAGHSVTCYNRAGCHIGGVQHHQNAGKTYKDVKLKTVPTVDKKGLAAVSSSFFAAFACAFSNAQVVHIHAEGPALMCWLPKLLGKQVVVTVHGLDWQREKWKNGFGAKYIRWGEKAAVRCADDIVVLSQNVQEYFLNTYGRKTVFIPNGVSRPRIAEARQITECYGLKKEEYLLFLGRLVPEKGVHYLIDAFCGVKTGKKLVIAGSTSDTDAYVKKLNDLAAQDDRIVFTGFVQGQLLEELYSNAYCYILPSDLEGMPLSLLEAMSYGNCCIVSDISECTSVVEDKALVFERGDSESLRQCLQSVCDDAELVKKYKADAAAFICEKYNWDTVTEKTLELYGEKK